ncbi:MAG: XdhC family protein, partial [Bryocella sp.]
MRERRRIVELYQRGEAQTLVTVVRVEGSSYRTAGARLLIAADGAYAGAISGGCLEAEILRRAAWSVRSGAVVEKYSTDFEDTSEMPYGLGCGGTLHVLLEPCGTPAFRALMSALEGSLRGETAHVTTALPTSTTPLQRKVVDANDTVLFS